MPLPAINLDDFLQAENLPEQYRHQAERYFLPFIERLLDRIRNRSLRVLGIHGAQGSGKSTLASFFGWYLKQQGLTVAQVSLDDFYLRRRQRMELGKIVHPLLRTRGVPGTHDVELGMGTLRALCELESGEWLRVPRFDKLNDDRYPDEAWVQVTGPVDVVIFEGWCLGATPQNEADLLTPINALERNEDADGAWRRYVNECLAEQYQVLFAEVDYLLMLKAPSFDCVAGWRLEQEQRLAVREPGKSVMNETQVARFVQHYERLTRHCLEFLPGQADCVMSMSEDRAITTLSYREPR